MWRQEFTQQAQATIQSSLGGLAGYEVGLVGVRRGGVAQATTLLERTYLTEAVAKSMHQESSQRPDHAPLASRPTQTRITSLVLVCGRTSMLHTLGEQRGDAASAGYGRTGGMSSSRCKCSWPRMYTTPPHGDRAGPGAGVRHEMYYTAAFRMLPPRGSTRCPRTPMWWGLPAAVSCGCAAARADSAAHREADRRPCAFGPVAS